MGDLDIPLTYISRSQYKILVADNFRFPSPIYTKFDPVMHPTIALDEFEDE